MILLIDNYDSFTYNLTDYFARLGEDTQVVMNDRIHPSTLGEFQFDRLVISPGPNTPSESGNLMQIIDVLHHRMPVLGICLGHQALAQYYGAELHLADTPMHGMTSTIRHNGEGIFEGLKQDIQVCRYHSLIMKGFENTPLEISSSTAKGECMSFSHKTLPVCGMQFHPEAILTEHGLDMLANWLRQTVPVAYEQA